MVLLLWGENITVIEKPPPPVYFQCILISNLYWIYSAPSMIVMFYIIYRLFSFSRFRMRPEFQSPFYAFLLQDYMLALFGFIVDIFIDRLPQTGLYSNYLTYNDPHILLAFFNISWIYAVYLLYYSSFSLSLIRLLAVATPIFFKKKLYLLVIPLLILIYIVPISTTWFLLPYDLNFMYEDVEPCPVIWLDWGHYDLDGWTDAKCQLYVSIILAPVGIFLVALTIYFLRKRTQTLSKIARKTERSLTLIAVTTQISLLMNIFCQIYLLVTEEQSDFIYTVRKLFIDSMVFVNAWMFYFSHPAMRMRSKFFSEATSMRTVTLT